MNNEEGRGDGRVKEASGSEAAGGPQRARVLRRGDIDAQGKPLGAPVMSRVPRENESNFEKRVRSASESSVAIARRTRQRDPICQKIIGRSMCARLAIGGNNFRGRGVFRGKDGAFALFDKPASKHGRRVLFEPLLEELGDFLAEIGGVSKAREFVRLKGGAGSGEKKFPRGLGAELRHVVLRNGGTVEWKHINNRVIHTATTIWINRLWKTVEKPGDAVEACSGCTGDYEDPDRSAWEEDLEDEDGVEGERAERAGGECTRGEVEAGGLRKTCGWFEAVLLIR